VEAIAAHREAMTPNRPGCLLIVMCAGMFLILLDVTVVNVAIPSIEAGLRAGTADVQWVVDAYALALASLLLAGGALGDRVGDKATVLAGLVIFGAASAGCALAPSPGALIAARAVQGAGAALLLPGSLAAIADAYPGRAEQARALGLWAAISALALPAGPLLGGLIVSALGWRAVFWINPPVTAVCVIGVLAWAGRSRTRVGGEAVGKGLADAFRTPAFWVANASALVMNTTANGMLFLLTQYLQSVLGHDPMTAGFMLLPLFAPMAVLSPLAGRLTARYGPRPVLAAGAALAAAGMLGLTAVTPDGGYWRAFPALAGIGLGIGTFTAPVVATAIRAVPPSLSGLASGLNNTARQAGTALGIAVFGAVAGSPALPGHFVTALRVLGGAAGVLWLLVIAATALGVRPVRPAAAAGSPPTDRSAGNGRPRRRASA
jgi:DHA2 family methylenomycin A resistance protein-like MFS transporter